ncbi:MAG: DUF4337 domain-containing protein [Acetobacteraceae bacterium]|nr:DUF4337 domain-containing protein [Acetobacteraceae bacterium]
MAGHGHADHGGDKRIALLIAILALFLAIAETGAKSAQTEALTSNIEAANLWAFFQARTIRQTTVRTAAEQAELDKAAADAAARAAIERQQAAWRATADRWESEPQTGEGRRELSSRARAAEAKRDRNLAAYHHFEFSSAAFQVAIVLASASIITAVPALAFGAIGLGVVGVALAGIGFIAPEAIHF